MLRGFNAAIQQVLNWIVRGNCAPRGSAFGRALLEGRAVRIPDVKADAEYTLLEGQRLGDYRTALAVPMLREGVAIGVMVSREPGRIGAAYSPMWFTAVDYAFGEFALRASRPLRHRRNRPHQGRGVDLIRHGGLQ